MAERDIRRLENVVRPNGSYGPKVLSRVGRPYVVLIFSSIQTNKVQLLMISLLVYDLREAACQLECYGN